MSHARESGFHPSSPRSSSGMADSFGGTPDTRLTTFSPEGGSSDVSSGYMRSLIMIGPETPPARAVAAPNRDRGPATQLDRDPFVTPTLDSRPSQRLSPTASAFRPFACPTHVGILQAVPDLHGVAAAAASAPEEPLLPNLSNNLGLSRCLYLAPARQDAASADINAYIQVEQSASQRYGSMLVVYTDKGELKWPMYVAFSDIRDAAQLFRSISMLGPGLNVNYVPSADFKKVKPAHLMIDLDGQLSITAVIAHPGETDVAGAMVVVKRMMQSHGPVAGFITTTGFEHGALRGIVEYCNASDAKAASAGCSGIIVDGIHMTLVPVRDDVAGYWPTSNYPKPADLSVTFHNMGISGHGGVATPTMATVPNHQTGPGCQTLGMPVHTPVHPAFQLFPLVYRSQFPGMQYFTERGHPGGGGLSPHGPVSAMSSMFSQSPTPLTVFRREDGYGSPRTGPGFGRGDNRRQHAARITRSPYFSSANHHNHVDIGRIQDGIDVRTTIMLRNIPNKVDQAMLKRIVDESSWGKYDFMYLRIDFANECNVGYAFINFVDPIDIIDFVNVRGNQRWNCFKSDKVAEISYATIQGKDCLVQKFRNSSVMLEPAHYRPKLYFTSNGPTPEQAGQEETFPEPDNQSKMKRSCENAEHVGLFTPHAGQHMRDEQRRRRSQYDRGSPHDAAEEYGNYEAAVQTMYGHD